VIPVEEARATILGDCPPLAPRQVALLDARGCVLAADVVASENVPPFANCRQAPRPTPKWGPGRPFAS
jgi:molybdopterin molybdotransferase